VLGGLALLVAASALLIGSVHYSVALGVTLVGLVGAALLRRELVSGWSAVSTVLALLSAYTLLQALPLPVSVLAVLSPGVGDIWSRSLQGFGYEGPVAFGALTLDTAGSYLEATKWSLYAVAAAMAAYLARERSLNAVLAIVWGSACLVAVVTILQAVSGSASVLGLYEPEFADPERVSSVLVNPNNLAGYANLGTFAGLGLFISRRGTVPRPLVAAGVAICMATAVLSGSRAGAAMLVLGLAALVVVWLLGGSRRKSRPPAARVLVALAPTLTLVLLGGLLAWLGGTERTLRELFDDDLSKLEEVPRLLPALREHWLFGIGRGAYGTVSQRYALDGSNIVREHVESLPMSWALEWGAPVAAAALLSFAWLLRSGRLALGGHRPAQAAYLGVLVLVGQNLADLALEVPGVCVALAGSRAERTPVLPAAPGLAQLRVAIPFVPALGLSAWLLAVQLGPEVYSLRRELDSWTRARFFRAESTATDHEYLQLFARLYSETRERPAEPYFMTVGAVAALQSGRDALPFAAAARERAPHSGAPHLLVAEALLQHGALRQALLELRLAMEADVSLVGPAAARALTLTRDRALLEGATPRGPAGVTYLLAVFSALSRKEAPHARRHFLALAAARSPRDRRVLAAEGLELLADLRERETPCLEEGRDSRCPLEDAGAHEQRILALADGLQGAPACDGLRLRAAVAAERGELTTAVDQLARCADCALPEQCALERAVYAQRIPDVERRRAAEQSYVMLACRSSATCAAAERTLGNFASARGDHLTAYTHFARAAARSPSGELWLATARSALSAGRLTDAEAAASAADRLGARDPDFARRLSEARQASVQKLLGGP
jgi:hypothetical protein